MKDQRAQLLRRRPERVELRVGQLLAIDAAADQRSAQPQAFDAVLQLPRREIGVLQRHGRERDEPLGRDGAELDQPLILDPDHVGGAVAVGAVPERVDAERRDIDPLLVHRPQPLSGGLLQQGRETDVLAQQRHRLGNGAVRVHIDHRHPAAVDHHLAPLCRRARHVVTAPPRIAAAIAPA